MPTKKNNHNQQNISIFYFSKFILKDRLSISTLQPVHSILFSHFQLVWLHFKQRSFFCDKFCLFPTCFVTGLNYLWFLKTLSRKNYFFLRIKPLFAFLEDFRALGKLLRSQSDHSKLLFHSFFIHIEKIVMLLIYVKKVENYKFYQLQHQFCFSATLGLFENLLLL